MTTEEKDDFKPNAPDFSDPPEEADASFPVDLTREEYIKFNQLVMKTAGPLRHRRGQTILLLILTGLCLGLMVTDKILSGSVDWFLLAILLVAVAAGGFFLLGMPRYLQRAAARAYARNARENDNYYGVVTVADGWIEKKGNAETNTLYFNAGTTYMETKDMMVFLSPGAKAIVLPARCMTQEDTARVRCRVEERIPVLQQKILQPMEPLAAERMKTREKRRETESSEAAIVIPVTYTPKEYVELVADRAGRQFVKMLGFFAGLSFLSGVVSALMVGWVWGIISFAGMFFLFYLFFVEGTRLKARRIVKTLSAEAFQLEFQVSRQGILVSAPFPGQQQQYPWAMVTRAVERPLSVEFYTETGFMRIPKRAIEDMAALRTLVDQYVIPRR